MTQPAAPVAPARVWTANRILMFVGGVLFVLASLAIAFGWDVNPWALGFGGFAAWSFAWSV